MPREYEDLQPIFLPTCTAFERRCLALKCWFSALERWYLAFEYRLRGWGVAGGVGRAEELRWAWWFASGPHNLLLTRLRTVYPHAHALGTASPTLFTLPPLPWLFSQMLGWRGILFLLLFFACGLTVCITIWGRVVFPECYLTKILNAMLSTQKTTHW